MAMSPHSPALLRQQRGVYALEWAIVFPVFFMLVYAIISYGLTMLVRESMQNAVEDGARAALRYQTNRSQRLAMAQEVVVQRLAWLPSELRPAANEVQVNVCSLLNEDACDLNLQCNSTLEERCLLRVELELSYGQTPLAPSLPGLGILLPERLRVSASILADRGNF